jgi:hypothetical protein
MRAIRREGRNANAPSESKDARDAHQYRLERAKELIQLFTQNCDRPPQSEQPAAVGNARRPFPRSARSRRTKPVRGGIDQP